MIPEKVFEFEKSGSFKGKNFYSLCDFLVIGGKSYRSFCWVQNSFKHAMINSGNF